MVGVVEPKLTGKLELALAVATLKSLTVSVFGLNVTVPIVWFRLLGRL